MVLVFLPPLKYMWSLFWCYCCYIWRCTVWHS